MPRTDTAVKTEGMQVLLEKLGEVDAERFISLIIKEPFDYTKWQSNMFERKSVRDISNAAMGYTQNL